MKKTNKIFLSSLLILTTVSTPFVLSAGCVWDKKKIVAPDPITPPGDPLIAEQYKEVYKDLKKLKQELLKIKDSHFKIITPLLLENANDSYIKTIYPFIQNAKSIIKSGDFNTSSSLTLDIKELFSSNQDTEIVEQIFGTKKNKTTFTKICEALTSLTEDAMQQLKNNAIYFQEDKRNPESINKLVGLVYDFLDRMENSEIFTSATIEAKIKQAYEFICNRIMHPNLKSLKKLEDLNNLNNVSDLIKVYNNTTQGSHNHSHSSVNMLWEFNWYMHLLTKFLQESSNELNLIKIKELTKDAKNPKLTSFVKKIESLITSWTTTSWSQHTSWDQTIKLQDQNYFAVLNNTFILLKQMLHEIAKKFKISNTNQIFKDVPLADGTQL